MTAALYPSPRAWSWGLAHDSHCRALVCRLWLGPLLLTWWQSCEPCLTPPQRRQRRELWARRALAGLLVLVAVAALVAAGRAG